MQSNVPFAGRLRLGVLPSIAPYLLPDAIRELHQDQPDLRVVLREENTLQLKEGLRSGRFDLIVSTPEDHPNARQIRLFREKLWVAVALDDPLAKVQGAVGPRDLEGQRFLTLDLGHRIARITYALAATCKGVVSDEYEGTSMDALVLMAASGAGVAIVPDLFARRQAALRQEVVLRPLELEGASRDIALLYRGERSDEREVYLVAKTLLRNAQKQGLEHLYADI
jgi:LysR family hydrogen peroxide-inducible transcriptional activator